MREDLGSLGSCERQRGSVGSWESVDNDPLGQVSRQSTEDSDLFDLEPAYQPLTPSDPLPEEEPGERL